MLIEQLIEDRFGDGLNFAAMIGLFEQLTTQGVYRHPLFVHHVVVFEQMFADREVVRFDVLLRGLDPLADHLRFDGNAFFHPQSLHNRFDTVAGEDAHQVVFERKEETRRAGVALASRTPAELVVNPARFVTLGAEDVQSAESHHFLVLGFRRRLNLGERFIELLRRVDVVPPSMAIAQAAVESGWGTSYAARVGNSLFGQIQPNGRHSVNVPWRPGPAMPQPFSSVSDSVDAYFLNLNTHFAYGDFRAERARMRSGGKEPDGYHLIGQLLRYSELGHAYVNFVRSLIRENQLSDFDRARLPPI